MAKIHPYHTNSPEHRREVYHDQDDCPDGKRIEHKHRVEGTDNRKHCLECEKIEHHHKEEPHKHHDRPPQPDRRHAQ